MVTVIDIPKGIVLIGARSKVSFPIRDVNGAPFALTGYSVQLDVRRRDTDAVVCSLTTGSGLTIADDGASIGALLVATFAEDAFALVTDEWAPEGLYDIGIKRTDAGAEYPLMEGSIWLERSSVRDDLTP